MKVRNSFQVFCRPDYWPQPGGGKLRRVTGIDVARAMTDIEDATISIPLGGIQFWYPKVTST
jgi:hypothetical protein